MKLFSGYLRLALALTVVTGLLALALPAVPVKAAALTWTIEATACAGGSISADHAQDNGIVTVSPGDNVTYTIKAIEGKSIQDVWIDKTTSVLPVPFSSDTFSYTFKDVQANHFIAASFSPFSLRLKVGETVMDINQAQFESLPGHDTVWGDNNNAFWKGVPLYSLISRIYPGDSTAYSVSAITVSPDNENNISFTCNSTYRFLDPETRDYFIVANEYRSSNSAPWDPIPPTSGGQGGWAWAPLRLMGNYLGPGNSSAFKHFGAGLVELDLTNVSPWITAQPDNLTLVAGNSLSLTAKAVAEPAALVKWQVSLDAGANWNDIPGVNSTNLTMPAITMAQNHYQYRAVFTNSLGSAVSHAAVLSVTEPPPPPSNPGGSGGGGGGGGSYISTTLFGKSSMLALSSSGQIKQTFSASSADGVVALTVPVGVTAKNSNGYPLSVLTAAANPSSPVVVAGQVMVGTAIDFGPAGSTFNPPLTLKYRYDPAQLPAGVDQSDLTLASYDGADQQWVAISSTLDTTAYTVSALIAHFSTFALVAILPADFSIQILEITPSKIVPGDEVGIRAAVTNHGGKTGDYSAVLMLNGVKSGEQKFKVEAGMQIEVVFSIAAGQPADYRVDVGGAQSSFKVISPAQFVVSGLSVQPATLKTGETTTITVTVGNSGGREDVYDLVLKSNGSVIQNQAITVSPGASQIVTFPLNVMPAGTYDLSVDDLNATLKVEEPIVTTTSLPSPTANPAPTTTALAVVTTVVSTLSDSPPKSGSHTNWLLIGAIIAAVLIAGVLVIWRVRK